MISCRLIHITHNPQGLQASNELAFTSDTIELGRCAACQILLPDHRVSLLHATISRSEGGILQVEAQKDSLIVVNGFIERVAVLTPGTRLDIGPYQLEVKNGIADTDLTLTIHISEWAATSPVCQSAQVNLAELGISKRRLGLGLVLAILLVFFLLPMSARFSPTFERWQADLPITFTSLLNPSPLSAGHTLAGAKCSNCHQKAFHGVADHACTECHRSPRMHLPQDHPRKQTSAGIRCIDCHAMHAGKAGTQETGMSQCVSCHCHLDSELADIRDFGKQHPPFQLDIPQGKSSIRVRQDQSNPPADNPGLKFSHHVHLDKKGVSSPDGRIVMGCRDCHELEDSGNRFAPMEMEKSCQQSRCHKIRFEEPANGVFSHGAETEMTERLRNLYVRWLADLPTRISGKCPTVPKGNPIDKTLACADHLTREHIARTITKGSECALCHTMQETGNPDRPWKIAPLRLDHDWQPKTVFSHARHKTMNCQDCHDKQNSKKSEDIAFPKIEKCRECHAGTDEKTGMANKVRSYCADCHRYHRIEKPSE